MKKGWYKTTGKITLNNREQKEVTCYKNDAYPGLFIHKDKYWRLTHEKSGGSLICEHFQIKSRAEFLKAIEPVFQYDWRIIDIADYIHNPNCAQRQTVWEIVEKYNNSKDTIEKARTRGFQDGLRGSSVIKNPYPNGSLLADAWLDGWNEQYSD